MTKEEILKRVKKFQGANREFSQELPPIIEGLIGLIDEAGPGVVNNLTSNSPTKALSANMGKELKLMVDEKVSEPETAGTAGQILQLDENGDPEWVEAAAVGATYDSAVSDTSTNAIQNKTIKKYVDDNFAQKDGYYSSLTAGAAENLVGRGSVPAEIAFRTSGGDQDLGTGSALITKILGRTEAFNQIVPNGNFADTSGWVATNSTLAAADNVLTATLTASASQIELIRYGANFTTVFASHRYLVLVDIMPSVALTRVVMYNAAGQTNFPANTWTNFARVFSPSADATIFDLYVIGTLTAGDTIKFKNCIIVDLTLEGLGLTTADQFRALHPLGYYSPASKLINNAATGLETTGFNQWDEEWELGALTSTDGSETSSTTQIRSKNYIPVLPNTTYYRKNPYSDAGTGHLNRAAFYDANKQYLGGVPGGGWIAFDGNSVFTTPAKAAYMKFHVNAITYNHDICINLSWSGYRNGEYEPYEKRILALPLNATACHDENNNAVVVNGLDGVGTAQDELIVENGWGTKINKKMEEVDLGDLEWIHEETYGRFVSNSLSGLIKDGNRTTKLICPLYTSIQNGEAYDNDWNKVIYSVSGSFLVHDLSFPESATGADFKAAMAGVKLRFELATPKVLTIDNPIPASYYVNDFGTEARLPQDTADNPQAPFCAEIQYAMNATDTIRRLPSQYISDGSMTNILTALKTAGIIADFTLTYDSEHQYFTCSVTAPTTEGE